ncbi:MAG: SAM-dependent methyltransferase [Rhodospirillaceae bacterium]|nr:SAM-dependent methyltransferase [Rhodospirillaceae bacterium]
MDHLDRVKEEFTRQADTFAVHAVKADEKVESRFQGAIGDAGKGVLLDVACGPGVVTAALAKNAARITAFDATPAMLEKARARCEEAGLVNVEFREGDAQAMPFADATFDGIVTRLAIHHFAEPAKVMSEMYRVLKPGGRAVIVDVIVSDNAEEAALQNAIEIIRDPSHIRMLPEAELFGGIKDAGFTIQDISGWDKDREFEEWCGIANDPQRIGPLRTIARTLAKDGRHAGFGLSVNDQDELVFFHRWRLIVADKPAA